MKFTYPSGSSPLAGYTIKRGIGRGGFGEVYFAISDAGKEVALKLLRRNLDVELRGVRQCLNLKHPNLVAIHDIRTDEMDDYWVVMEYVSGECLEDAIARNPNGMPTDQALYWMHGVTAGVAYLHDHGIVHRDLKPGNIFSDEGVIKIGDYGLSKFISCSRRSGQTESVGTVHYMAPEIANGRYGREIDIYALGIMLYEMLIGRVPFEGESVGEVLMKHLTAQPDLSQLEEPYRTIVAKALAKDPAGRLQSAAALRAVLPPPPADATIVMPSAVTGGAATGGDRPADDDPPSRGPASADPVGTDKAAHITAAVEDGEPIARALRRGWRNLETEWNHANLHPALRVAIIVGAVLLLVTNAGWWVPLLFLTLIFYSVYWVIRAMIMPSSRRHCGQTSPPAGAGPEKPARTGSAPAAMAAPPPPRRPRRWHRQPPELSVVKPPRQKVMELTGSMLLAAAIVLTMSVVMMILRGETMYVEQFTWMALVGTLGAWAVMVPAKVWEGRHDSDQALRRFTMLVVGLAIGAVAYGLAHALMVQLPHNSSIGGTGMLSLRFYDAAGVPTAMAYLAYFGFLLLIVRWWRQADPARGTRLSLWTTGVCVFWAWLLSQFWLFPQPWGLMVAAVISIAVQLASPWVPLEQRSIPLEEA